MRPKDREPSAWKVPAASLLVTCLAAACTPGVAERTDPAESGTHDAPRAVRTVQPEPAFPETGFPSYLYVERDVNVAARASGIIERVLADRGDRVKAGDPLAVMETDLATWELELAAQDARLAQAEYERLEPLYEKNVISQQEFVQAEIARDQAETRRELARAYLERCTVRAPYDGTIVERWAVEGQRIQEEDGIPLFRMVASEPLRARVDIPEERLDSLRVGSPAFVDDLRADKSHAARVVFVSPAIDAASGTVPIIVQMLELEEHLRLGAAVRVRFQEDPRAASDTFRLPRSALSNVTAHENEATTVMIVDDGSAKAREVRVVEISGTTVVVKGPLTLQDQVILGGAEGVREGESVRSREAAL